MRNKEHVVFLPSQVSEAVHLTPRGTPITFRFPPHAELDGDDFYRLSEVAVVLKRLFPNCDVIIKPRSNKNDSQIDDRSVAVEPSGSNRDKVRSATKDSPVTVADIATATGLDFKTIRGVLSAPDLVFKRERVGKVVCYQFTGTRERKRRKSAKKATAANSGP